MNKKRKNYSNSLLDKLWASKIKELAGNKCEFCGGTESLNAHHIQPRKIYATRWYLPNGVCLCVNCHTKGDYSAHRNPLAFYKEIMSIRGQEWAGDLIAETIKTGWQENLEQIKENLQ